MKDSLPPPAWLIAGGGPAGPVLALLLARQGVPVTLLEMHQDFDRDFRGDTLRPSILEIMDEIGLADHARYSAARSRLWHRAGAREVTASISVIRHRKPRGASASICLEEEIISCPSNPIGSA
jgi:2-polyprenyl-6-methoxyphenol hydroxylase-like FAD-dependent oxidoreductase